MGAAGTAGGGGKARGKLALGRVGGGILQGGQERLVDAGVRDCWAAGGDAPCSSDAERGARDGEQSGRKCENRVCALRRPLK